MQATKQFRVIVNPQKFGGPTRSRPKKKRHAKAKAKATPKKKKRNRRNSLAFVGPVNPQKGVSKMAKSRKKKKSGASRKHHKKTNPQRAKTGFFAHRSAPKKKRAKSKRKSNPRRRSGGVTIPAFSWRRPLDLAMAAVSILAGIAAARAIPQAVLKEKNTGWKGWGANLLVGLGLGGLLVSFRQTRLAGIFVAAGGAAYGIGRALQEQTSPIARILALSGVGDANAAGLGMIEQRSFPVPAVYDGNGQLMIPQDYLDQVTQMIAAKAAAASGAQTTMSGYSPTGRGGRVSHLSSFRRAA